MTLFLSNCALTITVNCFLQLIIKQECLRKSGYSVQADEEQLRYKAKLLLHAWLIIYVWQSTIVYEGKFVILLLSWVSLRVQLECLQAELNAPSQFKVMERKFIVTAFWPPLRLFCVRRCYIKHSTWITVIERFSLDCRKTKTKVNTLANQRT